MTKQPQILALLSGKGGSGKTVLALSMSKILNEAGHKILLIDCDTATHGATYFFEAELESGVEKIDSLSSILSKNSDKGSFLKTKSGFYFLPSTLKPTEVRFDASAEGSKSQIESSFRRLQKLYEDFDAVIFDCQAGYSLVTEVAVEFSKRCLIVLEPDAVSSAAIRVLYLQLGSKLKATNTWQIFNKLTEEERAVYEKLFGGTLFTNLPPIPFDWTVRAAFAICEIPSVTTKWSAFGLGILRNMGVLFPEYAKTLKTLEEDTVGKWHQQVTRRLKELEEQKVEIKYKSIDLKRRVRIRRLTLSYGLIGAISAFVTIFSFFSSTNLIPKTSEIIAILTSNPSALFGILGFLGVAASGLWYFLGIKDVSIEREQDYAQESITEIENELKKYRTLISTDPSLREFSRGMHSIAE